MISIKVKNVAAEFAKIRKEFKEEETLKLKDVCGLAVVDLKLETPVDTGYAQSRWKVTKGSVFFPFTITNDAPYIDFLNAGNSKQAPKYFVEQTMLRYGLPAGSVVSYKK